MGSHHSHSQTLADASMVYRNKFNFFAKAYYFKSTIC